MSAETPPSTPVARETKSTAASAVTSEEVRLSQPETAAQVTKPQGRAKRQLTLAASSAAAPRAPKAKTSGRIPAELWEEVRGCIVWYGHTMTIDSFTEVAFREHLKRLRKEHGLGHRFPAREHNPKQGRRVG